MKLEDVLRSTAKAVVPLYAAFHILDFAPVFAQPSAKSMYNFMVGSLHRNNSNLELALKSYFEALVADPNSAYLHNEMAEVLMDANRIEVAVLHLRNAIRLEKNFVKPHTNLALIHVFKNNYKAAVGESNFALSIEPNNLVALLTSAESCFKLKDYPSARSYFTRIIKLNANTKSVSYSTYMIGQLNFLDSEYFLAIREFEKAFVMLDKTDPVNRLICCDILHAIALSYFKMSKYNEANETIVTLYSFMNKEVDPVVVKGLNKLRERIKKEDLLKKIEEGIQNMNKKNTPKAAIPR